MGLVEDVNDVHGAEQRRTIELINTKKKQGTIKSFCIDKKSFAGAKPTETGGGGGSLRDDDVDHSVVEPRRMEAFVSNKYGGKTRGFRRKAMATRSKNKKMGSKSKTGKEPELSQPDSSQIGIRGFFSKKTRPEATGTPLGIGPAS